MYYLITTGTERRKAGREGRTGTGGKGESGAREEQPGGLVSAER